jgi:leucine-rich repeat protein SHOC2
MRRAEPGVFTSLELALETPAEVREIRLYASRQIDRIHSLPDLSPFRNLVTLDLWGQDLRSLEGIGSARGLVSLGVANNRNLESLDGIEALPALESVDVRGCRFEWKPAIGVLAKVPALTTLGIGGREQTTPPPELASLAGVLSLSVHEVRKTHDLAALVRIAGAMDGLRMIRFSSDHPIPLPEDLSPLSRLLELALGMSCPALPRSIGSLRSLTKLAARGNRLHELPAEIGDLESLRELDLALCRLTGLPDSIGRLAKLERLDLHWNRRLRRLPETIGSLGSLRELDLNGTGVKTLPGSLTGLASLRTLRARDIDALPEGFTRLRLENAELPPALASGLTLVAAEPALSEEVTIARAGGALPDDLGDPRVLVIRMPDLERVPAAFGKLRRLEELTLAAPKLPLGDALRALAGASGLRALTLGWTREPLSIPSEIGLFAATLEELRAPRVQLETLPGELTSLSKLTHLDLTENEIEALPDDLGRLSRLKALEVSHNPLARLPASIGELAELRELRLHMVPLRSLPDELARLELSVFALTGGKLGAVPRVLAKMTSLQELELRCDPPLDHAALFRLLGPRPLRLLNLSWNELEKLPPEIGLLTGVRELDLRHLKLTRLPRQIAGMAALQRLRFDWYRLDDAGRRDAKSCLPPGRWKKAQEPMGTMFVRTA